MKKLLIGFLLILSVFAVGCGGSKVPSGQDCGENVAYLQSGVDEYTKTFGALPTDLNQLLQSKDGKGPFVEKIPSCPSGNIYIIENGTVKEAPAK